MFVAREIPAEHKDLIHDVSYDYHGRRMATCSSDQSVKVSILGPSLHVILRCERYTTHQELYVLHIFTF